MALDLAQFHDAFFDESFEALDTMEAALLKLNVGAPEPELINTIFRVAHSIKGGSATFGFSEVASFTHTCETLLDELRGNRMQVTRYITDLLLKSVDVMRDMLRAVQHKTPIDAQRVADLQFDLELAIVQKNAPAAAAPAPSAPPVEAAPARAAARASLAHPLPSVSAAVRARQRSAAHAARAGGARRPRTSVVAAKNLPALRDLDPESCYLAWELTVDTDATREVIDQVFDWAEGDCELKIRDENAAAAGRRAPSRRSPLGSSLRRPRRPRRTRPAALEPARRTEAGPGRRQLDPRQHREDRRADEHGRRARHHAVDAEPARRESSSAAVAEQLRSGLAQLERNVRELQESVMRVRMLPISFVFSRFPRMVRDLSQRLGKQVDLKMIGEQTELDKTVLEKIGDPLVHLVRNSVDHGIEMPEARVAAGKPPTGVISLEAYHKGGNITVEVGDDGGGLQRDRILAKARERGLIGAERSADRRADLRADLHGRLLHRRPDHRHFRARRRHGRRAPEHQGARRHDRSALDSSARARASSSRCR